MHTTKVELPEGARLRASQAGGTNLADLRPGEEGVVRAVQGANGHRRRLLEMGFVSGTRLRLVRLAPFGDPMQIALHGYSISLRRSEAREILVDRT